MEIQFTPEQQKVIDLHDRNILVAAAAGSGKTAVLVERIVQLISDPEKKTDIDRLLIVTFTSAAASEMRERISAAISKKLNENPLNEHLQKQSTLLYNAQITTISSFCLFLIRNHFQDIGLDPVFRVADEGECKLLKQDVLKDLLEEKFAEATEDFLHCVETYSINGSEKALEEAVLRLHEFSMSYPWPDKWLEECKSTYLEDNSEGMQTAKWMQFLCAYIKALAEDFPRQLDEAIAICEQSDGPYMYVPLLETEKEMLSSLIGCESYEAYREKLAKISFARLPSKKDETVSEQKRDFVKNMRNQIKATIGNLQKNYFYTDMETAYTDLKMSKRAVCTLLDLVIEFNQSFAQKKREKNIIDFSDMEHLALQILLEEKDGKMVPTKTARSYQEYFEEILIDEYQDSNLVQEYLLQSISKEDRGLYNRFMVGDVKQSIYKFRLARPEIFMEKYENYETADSDKQRIDLSKNFRSREEVISFVNATFEKLMQKSIGGISYEKEAFLYLGSSYEKAEQNQEVEVLLLKKSEELLEEASVKEREALLIAKKIKKLVGSFLITDKKSGKLRPCEYRDIVILLRSNAGWDEEFKSVLTGEGIPTHITSKTGYFSAYEVQLVLNFLRVLDNPLQDIPLCGVLVSPLHGFSEEELAMIKSECEDKKARKLYQKLAWYTQNGKNAELKKRIQVFLNQVEIYREQIPYTPIHELMQNFMRELSYEAFITAMPAGEQRRANIDMLLEKAIQFESTSYHGLFHFIRYIEQMEKYQVDFGEANISDENDDVVRIMSIHKSKGLEFPICFVSGLAKQFNQMDLRKSLIADMDYGIGVDYIDPVKRIKVPTIRKNAIVKKMELDNLGEELRVLYVALTRAKEKLILTGMIEDNEAWSEQQQKVSFSTILSGKCYLDWILASISEEGNFEQIVQIFDGEELIGESIREEVRKEFKKEKLLQKGYEEEIDKELQKVMEERFSFVYPYQILEKLYTKTTVSELKKAGMKEEGEPTFELYQEEEITPYLPKFIQEKEEVSPTMRGSAYHKVFELLDLCKSVSAREQMEELLQNGKLQKDYFEVVQSDKVEQFLQSDLAKRMKVAESRNELFREQPFVIAVPANEIENDFPETEAILVQGIIDVYFEEDGELVVADYKTDRVKTAEELVQRYEVQLVYYAKALEQLTGKRVKEKIIYSLGLNCEIRL